MEVEKGDEVGEERGPGMYSPVGHKAGLCFHADRKRESLSGFEQRDGIIDSCCQRITLKYINPKDVALKIVMCVDAC